MELRAVFLGTPDFAIPSLKALLQARAEFDVVGVFTQPDRPSGRGLKLMASPVKRAAQAASLRVFQPARIRGNEEALKLMRRLRPDIAVVVAFGQILPPDLFSIPGLGCINVHASLLPAYRGAAPVAHAIWNGERVSGVTIMRIDEGMDSGDILAQEETPIGPDMTAAELGQIMALRGAQLLIPTLIAYAAGRLEPQPQDHLRATRAPMLTRNESAIDWSGPASRVHNQVRALNPRPVAFCTLGPDRLKVWRSRLVADAEPVSVEPATVTMAGPDQLHVACGDGRLVALEEVQLPNRRRTAARDFLNGVELKVGDRLG